MEIARWWNSATQAARYQLYGAAIRGAKEAPPLDQLRLAVILAETEAGEVEHVGCKALAF